ncbi:fimbrial protein [Pseudomonas sp. 51_B]|uniref:fimbrial protein n=1 Tax=Pseudomonas sp. 51_B TaxID=2813573 RepID=UPI001A9CE5C0|nr:fimbrial protein [Pseudomonas sp. 51_B]
MKPLIKAAIAALFCLPAMGHALDASEVRVSGTLVRPLCTTLFPVNQTVTLPAVSLNTLMAGTSQWAEVPLEFRCAENTQVKLRFVAAGAAYDGVTLRTTVDGLGLRLRLRDDSQGATALDMRLNETLGIAVSGTGLRLNLGARSVMVGDQPPTVGNYQSQVLMVIDYL